MGKKEELRLTLSCRQTGKSFGPSATDKVGKTSSSTMTNIHRWLKYTPGILLNTYTYYAILFSYLNMVEAVIYLYERYSIILMIP